MSHLGAIEGQGEEEEEARERPDSGQPPTSQPPIGQPPIGQLLLAAAWQNLSTMTGQPVPLPVTSPVLPSPGVELTTQRADSPEESGTREPATQGPMKRAAPTEVKPLERKTQQAGIRAAIKYLTGQKAERDYYITKPEELLEYASGHEKLAAGVLAAYNETLGEENAAYHLSVEDEPESDDRVETKKPRRAEPFDFAAYWAPGTAGNAVLNAQGHFSKHGQQAPFAYDSAEAYTKGADEFRRANSRDSQTQLDDQNKWIICKYSRQSAAGIFLVLDSNKKILSFYPLTPATLRELWPSNDMEGYLQSKVGDLGPVYTD